jgi:hypothetical protein
VTESPRPPAPHELGTLRLVLQGSALTASMITPTVLVNGWRIQVSYGENLIPVYAGPNRVEVSAQWLTTYGRAALDVQVPLNGQVDVYYALPWHTFTGGAIGHEKQRRPGLLVILLIASSIVALALLFFLVPLLS